MRPLALHGGIGTHGEYWVNVRVSSSSAAPSFKVRLQVDTGSSGLVLLKHNASLDAAPSIACKECASKCDALGHCPFHLEFGDGSTQYALHVYGRLALLDLDFGGGGRPAARVPVHLAYNVSGNLPTRVDGILGLAFRALDCNPTCVDPAWGFVGQSFEIQLGDHGGQLRLFAQAKLPPAASVASKVLDAPVVGNPKAYYAVEFPGIAVSNELVYSRASTLAVIDSGTTLIILAPAQFDAIRAAMQRDYCHLPGVCGLENVFQPGRCLVRYHAQYPPLYLFLGKGAVKVPPSLYFFNVQGVYCLAIQRGPPGLRSAILGDALLRGFTTSFSPRAVRFAERNASWWVDNLSAKDGALVLPTLKHGLASPRPSEHLATNMLSLLIFFLLLYFCVLRCLGVRGSTGSV